MPILVTGGAGYVGSHVVRLLTEAGHDVVVLDNLSTGFADALIHGEQLIVADIADQARLDSLLRNYHVEAVLHFAASIVAPESVTRPVEYYRNNTVNLINLLEACERHDIRNIVFSSTAAVYGNPDAGVASETTPPAPINPYGTSKLMGEWILRDAARAQGLRYVALRYFNVAGADPLARMGQRTRRATHLIKVCCEAALGRRKYVEIYGVDYPTCDGTGVRDYVHVEDLATAHVAALNYLKGLRPSVTLNVGYGVGYSVREVIETTRRVSGVNFNAIEAPRRSGDAATLVANADKIRTILAWTPRHVSLDSIIADTWRWESELDRKSGRAQVAMR